MNKKIVVVVFLYVFQFLASACDSCDCPGSFERNFERIDLSVWNIKEGEHIKVENEASFNDFNLSVFLFEDLVQVAHQSSFLNIGSLGFQTVNACSCPVPDYIVNDKVKSLTVLVKDTESNSIIDVTEKFKSIDDSIINTELLNKMFNNEPEKTLEIKLIDTNDVPKKSVFLIEITLESGQKLTKETQKITFQ